MDISWLPWQREELISGYAFAANIDLNDYFRLMHDLTRKQWLDEKAHTKSAVARYSPERRYARMPTADELLELEARSVFVQFCQSITDPPLDADVAAPNAAPPHR